LTAMFTGGIGLSGVYKFVSKFGYARHFIKRGDLYAIEF
jgi:hypothetical protein